MVKGRGEGHGWLKGGEGLGWLKGRRGEGVYGMIRDLTYFLIEDYS